MTHRIACLIALTSAFCGCLDSIGEGPIDENAPLEPTAHPPERPSAVVKSGTTRWFVVSKVKLGLSDASGILTPKAWTKYGYDLDGRWTTEEDSKTSVRSCKRAKGSRADALVDGEGGIDNNFGKDFMSLIKSLKFDVEQTVNDRLDDGSGATMILRLDNVGADDNASVPGALYRTAPGTKLGEAHLPIDARSVDAAGAPLARFPKGYMSKGTWVSGDGADAYSVVFPSIAAGVSAEVPLVSAVISFDVKSGKNGVFAGAAPRDRFRAAMTPAFEAMGACDGNATAEQIWATVESEADLASGVLHSEEVECNALSVGIGFEVRPTSEPAEAVHVETPRSADCAGSGG
jgi:hypothetical protein